MGRKGRFSQHVLIITWSTHFTAGVKAQEQEIATTLMPPQDPEANVQGDMIPQAPKDHGKQR